MVGGDINAGSFAVDQQLLFRPGLDWWRWGTPVKGCTWPVRACRPGAEVDGACGDLAARQALADQHRPGRLAAAAALGMAMATIQATRHRSEGRTARRD